MIGYGNSYFISTILDTESGVAPVNTVAPAITGTAQEGQTLTCSTGTWTGTPTITYAYQWKRNGSNIGSATNSTYLLVTADVGQSIKCTVTATNVAGSVNADSNTVTPTAALDPNAQAFITAAAITNPTQQAAINTLVVDLKGYNIWSKMKAVYPFVGGTASAHKFNLKNPLDTDAAFRLVFNGGFTHSSTGALPNGTNAYANAFLNYSTQLTNSNLHFSWYSRTAATNGAFSCEMIPNGNYTVSQWSTFRINNKISGNAYFSAGDDNVGATISQTQSGFFIGSETASNLRKLFRNGSAIATNTTNDTNVLPNLNLNFWGNTLAQYSANNCAFASIGSGLTDTEAANFYTAVQAFQTTLGRQI